MVNFSIKKNEGNVALEQFISKHMLIEDPPVRDDSPVAQEQLDMQMNGLSTELELFDLPRPLRDLMIEIAIPFEAAAINTRSAPAKSKTPSQAKKASTKSSSVISKKPHKEEEKKESGVKDAHESSSDSSDEPNEPLSKKKK